MTPWWTPQEAGLLGAIGGSTLGILGAILGTLGGVLAPRGKARRLVVGSYALALAGGAAVLIAGLAAVFMGQPYHVWYPLVLSGGLLTVLLSALFPVLLLRYRQAEARRMEAEEFRRM